MRKVIPFPINKTILSAAAEYAWGQLEAAENAGLSADELKPLIYRAYDLKDRAYRIGQLQRRKR